jgi:hypothetical protein
MTLMLAGCGVRTWVTCEPPSARAFVSLGKSDERERRGSDDVAARAAAGRCELPIPEACRLPPLCLEWVLQDLPLPLHLLRRRGAHLCAAVGARNCVPPKSSKMTATQSGWWWRARRGSEAATRRYGGTSGNLGKPDWMSNETQTEIRDHDDTL